jgi:hypothetical protein
MDKTILVTIHGSHLYGLNHSESDLDFFRVVEPDRKTQHKVSGGFDVVTMGFPTFIGHVFAGSHQSCEALFSPVKYVDPQYASFFAGMRVTGEDAFARYRRTIRAFSYGDDKRRRHAVRLGYNLRDLRRTGQFNPELTPDQRNMCNVVSSLYWGQSLTDIAINL